MVKDIDGKKIPPEVIENSKVGWTIIDVREILNRLDKIIELLELRNSIERAKYQISSEDMPAYLNRIFSERAEIPGVSDTNICNCGDHKSGELTGGWHCPVHGQCF